MVVYIACWRSRSARPSTGPSAGTIRVLSPQSPISVSTPSTIPPSQPPVDQSTIGQPAPETIPPAASTSASAKSA